MQRSLPILSQVASAAAIAALVTGSALAATDASTLRSKAEGVFEPLPAQMPGAEKDTSAMVKLGRKLFFEKKLSADKTVSCNACHELNSKGGAYDKPLSRGALGKQGGRNSPTVLNAGFHFAQFWDGRADDLEAQAKQPMLNPDEMGLPSGAELLKRLRESKPYPAMFRKAFPTAGDPVSCESLARAIAAFERTLITRDRFDDFLKGDDRALTGVERKGLNTFLETGCQKCHNGPAFGGNSYQRTGLFHPYANTNDLGRARITGDDADRYKFKVPSLRNVALTAPYFHDGKVPALDDAVRQMAYLQLNRQLTSAEVESIVAFLHTLSDKQRVRRIDPAPPRH